MSDLFRRTYTVLTYVSGVLYFMSTCINPLLYSIMSHKFRDAFKVSLDYVVHVFIFLFVVSFNNWRLDIPCFELESQNDPIKDYLWRKKCRVRQIGCCGRLAIDYVTCQQHMRNQIYKRLVNILRWPDQLDQLAVAYLIIKFLRSSFYTLRHRFSHILRMRSPKEECVAHIAFGSYFSIDMTANDRWHKTFRTCLSKYETASHIHAKCSITRSETCAHTLTHTRARAHQIVHTISIRNVGETRTSLQNRINKTN